MTHKADDSRSSSIVDTVVSAWERLLVLPLPWRIEVIALQLQQIDEDTRVKIRALGAQPIRIATTVAEWESQLRLSSSTEFPVMCLVSGKAKQIHKKRD